MAKHAKFSPSGAHRWLRCLGSISFIEELKTNGVIPKDPTSVYAEEGTAAHTLGEKCLKTNTFPHRHVGTEIKVSAPGGSKSYQVTKEMADAVAVYTSYIESINVEGMHPHFEQKVALTPIHSDIYGTCDFYGYNTKTRTVTVVDYKHGAGVAVYPKNNEQLMIYAIGAVYHAFRTYLKGDATRVDNIQKVRLVIVQPRADEEEPIKIWETDIAALKQWSFYILREAINLITDGDTTLCAGSHCKFCPAIAVCPKQAERALSVAKTTFQDPVLPRPEDLSPEDIAKLMEVSSAITKWSNEVASFAKFQMQKGVKLPGHKLVRKTTNRKWKNNKDAEEALYKLLGDGAYAPSKVLSVAQAEKVLKTVGAKPDIISDYWTKPAGDLVIAVEQDKREAVTPALTAFADELAFLQ